VATLVIDDLPGILQIFESVHVKVLGANYSASCCWQLIQTTAALSQYRLKNMNNFGTLSAVWVKIARY